jgi:hypothetical protein
MLSPLVVLSTNITKIGRFLHIFYVLTVNYVSQCPRETHQLTLTKNLTAMIQESYSIRFAFTLEDRRLAVPLTAMVEFDANRQQYHIKNLRTLHATGHDILPDMRIKKVKGQWVYSDSGRANNLSLAVGHAIDHHQSAAGSERHKE